MTSSNELDVVTLYWSIILPVWRQVATPGQALRSSRWSFVLRGKAFSGGFVPPTSLRDVKPVGEAANGMNKAPVGNAANAEKYTDNVLHT